MLLKDTAWIYALEPKSLSWDRFYKVGVISSFLYGLRLASQVHDQASAKIQLIVPAQIFGFLMIPFAKKLIRKRIEKEREYDELDPANVDLIKEKDKHNFLEFRGHHTYFTRASGARANLSRP